MDGLIIQVLNGSGSRFEEERLKRWREAAPQNEAYFQEMRQVWEMTSPEPINVTSGPPSVEEILAAAPLQLAPERRGPRVRREPSRHPWKRWGLLAASVAAVGLGIQVFGLRGPEPLAVYEGAPSGSRTVTLTDGSFARLAEGSTLREWEAEGLREVSLEGRAFFAVSRDESHPFVVRTGAGEVRVLGTRFQVQADEDAADVVVVEGLVRLSNDEGSVEVPAGNVGRMAAREEPVAEEAEDVFALLDWEGGVLVFHATPLSQVVEEVSRHYGRDLRIGNPDLGRRRVTAWFEGEPFEAVAESLCVVTEASCRVEGEGMTMSVGGEEEGP